MLLPRGPDRRQLLIGLLASVALHALLILLPPRRETPAPSPRPIELELVYTEPSEPPQEEILPGPGPAAVPAPAPAPPTRAPKAPPQTESAAAGPEGSQGATPVEEQAAPSFRREEEAPLDLAYRPSHPPPTEPDVHVEPAPSEAREIEARLETYYRDKRAEEHARTRAEPALVELRERLDRRFSVPREILEEAPGSSDLGMGDALRAYAVQAERYGATGNPYGEGPLAPGSPEGPETLASEVFRHRNADAELGAPISRTSATITRLVARIEVARSGAGIEARVWESSGVPRFDRLALEEVRRELARVELPPEVQRTRWAFVSTLRVTPPSLTVGCSFDQAFIPQECFYPGSKHQRSRVLLEAVYLE